MASIITTEAKIRSFLTEETTFFIHDRNSQKSLEDNLKANVEIAISRIIVSYKEAGFVDLNAFYSNETGSVSVTAYTDTMFIDVAIHSENEIDFELSYTDKNDLVDEAYEEKFGLTIDEACELIKSVGERLKK